MATVLLDPGPVARLRTLVARLAQDGVIDRPTYKDWKKKEGSEAFMEECLGYRRKGTMPAVSALLAPYFHKTLPLIGLNYSPVAHNTLHAFPDGWTPAIRLCRGAIFDRENGALVAMAFPKFFNHGEHAESSDLPDMPFVATVKHDGHLGIIFRYRGEMLLATRQSFHGPTATLGNEMLAAYVAKRGKDVFPQDTTVLAEIIHPKTKVHVDYGRKKGFVVLGVMGLDPLRDLGYEEVGEVAKRLKLPVTERWTGSSVRDLQRLMKDKTQKNQEGFVARFADGRRVKFKFESYIGLMVEEKLTYGYLMKRMITGNLDRMISTLDAEVRPDADKMVKAIRKATRFKDVKKQREYLYALDAEKQKNQHYRGICREYLKSLSAPKKTAAKKKAS